ncbi:helix-turn-helix domain-containing protein [Serratia marcescens]|nr:helix-turn-helix domain-containing protein [Serratia marcescens]
MKDTSKEYSSHRVNQLLEANNWSQTELAKRVGVSPQAVQQWVKGTSAPRGKSLTKLSVVTGLPEHWFFMAPGDNEENELIVKNSKPLTYQQERLLSLFEQLPEDERNHMIKLFEEKVKYFDKLRDELVNIKNKTI